MKNKRCASARAVRSLHLDAVGKCARTALGSDVADRFAMCGLAAFGASCSMLVYSGEGRLTEHITAAQARRPELVFMPNPAIAHAPLSRMSGPSFSPQC